MKEMIGGCCVCSDERGWDENPLVYCDGQGCTVAVHQACYGIVTVPTGPWYCRKCESQEKFSKVKCELCPSKDGALKKTDTNGWAHVICALYIPEVRFENVTSMEPIILAHIPPERFNKACYICEDRGNENKSTQGACMQCNKIGCKQNFHVTCAQALGLLCEEAGNYIDNVKYCGYCQYHYSKLRKNGNVKPIPPYKPVQFPVADVFPERDFVSFEVQNNKKKGKMNNTFFLNPSSNKLSSNIFSTSPTNAINNLKPVDSALDFSNPDEVQKVREANNLKSVQSPILSIKHKCDSDIDTNGVLKFANNYFTENVNLNENVFALENLNKPELSTEKLKRPIRKNNYRISMPLPVLHSGGSAPNKDSLNESTVNNSIIQAKLSKNGKITNVNTSNFSNDSSDLNTVVNSHSDIVMSKVNFSDLSLSVSQVLPLELSTSQKKDNKNGNKRKSERRNKRPKNEMHKMEVSNLNNDFPSNSNQILDDTGSHIDFLSSEKNKPSVFRKIRKRKSDILMSGINANFDKNSNCEMKIPSQLVESLHSDSKAYNLSKEKETPSPIKHFSPDVSVDNTLEGSNLNGPSFPYKSSSSKSQTSQSFPQSLEQLLERQWEQGSQFLMEQAQHFDIASLLSCLYQLRQENSRLEEHVNSLIQRRDHLLAVNARLSVPLSLNNNNPSKSTSVNSQIQRTGLPYNRILPNFSNIDHNSDSCIERNLPHSHLPTQYNFINRHSVQFPNMSNTAMRINLPSNGPPDLQCPKTSTPELKTSTNNSYPVYQVVSPPLIHPVTSQVMRREISEDIKITSGDKL